MKYLISIILFFCLNCNLQKNILSSYNEITNIIEEDKNCNKIFRNKNGELLNGKYKIKISKNFYKYAEYKTGFYINDVFYVRNKNIIWYKEKYDSTGKLLKYIHYQRKLKKEILKDELNLYAIEKYDSVSTSFKNQLPMETIFYYGSLNKKVQYTIKPQNIYITTNFNNIKIDSLDGSFNGISKYLFSMCPENTFLYNTSNKNYYIQVKVQVKNPNQKVEIFNYYLHTNNRGFTYYDFSN